MLYTVIRRYVTALRTNEITRVIAMAVSRTKAEGLLRSREDVPLRQREIFR